MLSFSRELNQEEEKQTRLITSYWLGGAILDTRHQLLANHGGLVRNKTPANVRNQANTHTFYCKKPSVSFSVVKMSPRSDRSAAADV